jgi:hypothetical protein
VYVGEEVKISHMSLLAIAYQGKDICIFDSL